jgi:hypothetical protein
MSDACWAMGGGKAGLHAMHGRGEAGRRVRAMRALTFQLPRSSMSATTWRGKKPNSRGPSWPSASSQAREAAALPGAAAAAAYCSGSAAARAICCRRRDRSEPQVYDAYRCLQVPRMFCSR